MLLRPLINHIVHCSSFIAASAIDSFIQSKYMTKLSYSYPFLHDQTESGNLSYFYAFFCILEAVSDRFQCFSLRASAFADAFGNRTAAAYLVVKTTRTAIEKPHPSGSDDAHGFRQHWRRHGTHLPPPDRTSDLRSM